MDAPNQPPKAPAKNRSTACCIWLFVAFVFWVFVLPMGDPEILEGMDAGVASVIVFAYLSPWFQMVRFPLLRALFGKDKWTVRTRDIALVDWFASLFTGALLAFPLANLSVHGGYTGSLLVTRRYNYMLYGQILIRGYEVGIPDYFIALAFAILVDLLLFWGALYSFRKADLRSSLRIALIINAAIYIPITFLYLVPYLSHKVGW